MNKKSKRIIGAVLIIAVCAAVILAVSGEKELKLIGSEEKIVNINEEYVEEGTNIEEEVKEGDVDTSKPGDYIVTYTYKEQKIKRTVHVVDPSNLVVGLKGSSHTKVKQGEPYIESGAFAIDKNTGAVKECEIEGDVDTSKAGIYEVIYTFKSGYLTKSVTRKVEVMPESEFDADTDGVSVLMYHYVYTENDKPKKVNSNYILDTKLEQQLKYLKENDYYFPSFKELRAYADGKISLPRKSVILTFDDGQKGFLKYGVSLLNKYEIPATSFLIGINDGENKIKNYASQYVSFESHSYNMHHAGGNIGHGGVISAMTKKQIKEDLQKEISLVGSGDAFAYPYGDVTEDAKKAVEEVGIQCAFTTAYDKVHVGDDFRVFSRIRVNGDINLENYKNIL